MVTPYTRPWIADAKAKSVQGKYPVRSSQTVDVLTSPFEGCPRVVNTRKARAKDVGAESQHISLSSRVGKAQRREVLDIGSLKRTELGTAGMKLKEDIPLVVQQIEKISSLNKLHAAVSQIEFKEIYQNNIPLGERLTYFLGNWKLITRDTYLLESISGYKIEFHAKPMQTNSEYQIILSKMKTNVLNSEVEEMLSKRAVEFVQSQTKDFVCLFVCL
jgi:hypothetical protein